MPLDDPDQPTENTAPALRLNDQPDWAYVLREFYDFYLRSSAGGSAKIRSHQRIVREQVSKILESNAELLEREPLTKPVCKHLKRALDRARLERTAPIARAIDSIVPRLSWQYGYEKLPKHLANKFAYAEIAGPNGPVVYDGIILGLVLFAPKCVYPTHNHDGITESYFCLSGAMSENDDGVYAPGSLIFNPPGRSHRITVADREPCLLAYAWAGPKTKLADQKMVLTKKRS